MGYRAGEKSHAHQPFPAIPVELTIQTIKEELQQIIQGLKIADKLRIE